MKKLWKRNAVVGAVLVLVVAAIVLNGRYAADAQVASEVAQGIEALASYTMTESQIENMVTAKGYDDCVVFLSDESVSVVVSSRHDGLQTEDVARITDIVKQETGLPASAIKILEVS